MRLPLPVLFCLLAFYVSASAQNHQTSKYDKFTDETTVSVRYFHPLKGVNMEASYKYRGQGDRIVPPKTVVLLFVAVGPTNFLDTQVDLFVLSDEKRFKFAGDAAFSPSITSLSVPIPFDKFEALMSGKTIEMRLGSDDLNLSGDDIKALRDFLPQPIRPKP